MANIVYVGGGDTVAWEFGGGIIVTGVIGHSLLVNQLHYNLNALKPFFLFLDNSETLLCNREIVVIIVVPNELIISLWIISFRILAAQSISLAALMVITSGFEGTAILGVNRLHCIPLLEFLKLNPLCTCHLQPSVLSGINCSIGLLTKTSTLKALFYSERLPSHYRTLHRVFFLERDC